jgi:hypothetical protein
MARRLSKVAKELNIEMSIIANFLINEGYECEENPNEKIEEDIFEFIKDNISAYLIEQNKPIENIVIEDEGEKKDVSSSLDLKIIEAASREKKLIERIVGFTDFDWQYTIGKYEGTCSQPVKFTLFDEILSGLLLIEEMGMDKLGAILGLDVQTDPAEREILVSAINALRKDGMIDGDESVYWLTDIGKEYAKNGEKFSTFQKNFDLYIDNVGSIDEKAKEVFSDLRSEKSPSINENNVPKNIEEIKPLAELQAPEIHFPDKGFRLQACKNIAIETYMAKVWVILLENFRDNTIRALVYDEKKDQIIEPLSEAFDQLEDEKQAILEKLIKISEQEDFSVAYTDEPKQEAQIAIENDLIEKQHEIEVAIESQDVEKVSEIQKEVVKGKRLFNSLEFEVELKRLFDETRCDMWIISPWIKRNAINRRLPFFEKYLQKGGRIFIAYSLPENDTEMADENALNKLLELEKRHQNFYIHQLPSFHYKRVWIRDDKKEKHLYYTGSYNILSFFVKQGLQNVRQEEMTKLLWDEENENEYKEVLTQFAAKYMKQATLEFEQLITSAPENIDKEFLKKIKSLTNNKLRFFVNKNIEGFDDEYTALQDKKEEKLKLYKRLYFDREIDDIEKEVKKLQSQTISLDKSKSIKAKLNALLNEFSKYKDLKEVNEISQSLQKIKTFSDYKGLNNKKNKKKK